MSRYLPMFAKRISLIDTLINNTCDVFLSIILLSLNTRRRGEDDLLTQHLCTRVQLCSAITMHFFDVQLNSCASFNFQPNNMHINVHTMLCSNFQPQLGYMCPNTYHLSVYVVFKNWITPLYMSLIHTSA